MPFKHTSTELTVLARDGARETASIKIGTRTVYVNLPATPADADERYHRHTMECQADAAAIYALLKEHLPEETRSHLSHLYRIEGT